ncbi:alpha/beta hydrolase [Lysobacter panacisoli]|uniref:Alpha/beta hydrolase n=1 Tax=Lysobacter panacisoli TaxID=1255263 RepID=A0ABP9LJL2_9GAMM|nr:alpha/beta hydrolase [Lysobacter panacisoli]
MKAWLLLLLVIICPARAGTIVTEVPESPDAARIHLIYLHGRIIENAGPRPTDVRYGLYDYPAILDALSSRGAVVISAQRPHATDVNRYAGVVVSQIETLIERGVPPEKIVVVGFSKGGAIAARVSSFLRRPAVRFVLLATCPRESAPSSLRFTGQVLSIFETSDTLGGSCRPIAEQAERPASFKETALSTGKMHGAFYLPLPAWLDPVLDWVHGGGPTI